MRSCFSLSTFIITVDKDQWLRELSFSNRRGRSLLKNSNRYRFATDQPDANRRSQVDQNDRDPISQYIA
jgi:hypothetical protein